VLEENYLEVLMSDAKNKVLAALEEEMAQDRNREYLKGYRQGIRVATSFLADLLGLDCKSTPYICNTSSPEASEMFQEALIKMDKILATDIPYPLHTIVRPETGTHEEASNA
jgi:hypothetical protein